MKNAFLPIAASPHHLVTQSDVIIILVHGKDNGVTGPSFAALNDYTANALKEACQHVGFFGETKKRTVTLPSLPGAPGCAVILHDCSPKPAAGDGDADGGEEDGADADNGDSAETTAAVAHSASAHSDHARQRIRLKGERVGGQMRALLEAHTNWKRITVVDDGEVSVPLLQGFVEGFWLYDWTDTRFRTKMVIAQPKRKLTVAASDSVLEALSPRVADAEHAVNAVAFCKSMVSAPGNVLYPETMAKEAKALSKIGVTVEVLTETAIEKAGMRALLGVAKGATNKPRVVVMQWQGGAETQDTLALVGKGVTFDSGGLSLKPPKSMEDMKWDMAGAGAVIATMKLVALRRAKANVVGIVGLVENMPDGNAQRPGDIVSSLSGQTIEVLNTDAEGRLVLADLLTYVQTRYSPSTVIDLATLTGAIIVALGHEHGGLFANSDGLARQLTQAGAGSGDKLWRLPLHPRYNELLKSDLADMKNIGGAGAGSITAAQFLQRFVQGSTKWAHLDIAGMAWQSSTPAGVRKGASGFGVRLLDHYITNEWVQ
ncbi:MAG: leucyl aminopeptidase [Alphaproteobacteria bacterium]|nr:leucyl aminopeptidase [Alphaproteobacteria bacterium]